LGRDPQNEDPKTQRWQRRQANGCRLALDVEAIVREPSFDRAQKEGPSSRSEDRARGCGGVASVGLIPRSVRSRRSNRRVRRGLASARVRSGAQRRSSSPRRASIRSARSSELPMALTASDSPRRESPRTPGIIAQGPSKSRCQFLTRGSSAPHRDSGPGPSVFCASGLRRGPVRPGLGPSEPRTARGFCYDRTMGEERCLDEEGRGPDRQPEGRLPRIEDQDRANP
jgi:hypothetical protein